VSNGKHLVLSADSGFAHGDVKTSKINIQTNEQILKTDDIVINNLTLAAVADFHCLRLEATRLLPQAFGPSHVQLKKMSVVETENSFNEIWDIDDNFIACAWCNENLIGTIGLQRVTEGNAIHTAVVWSVYVKPAYQGRGVARRLMQYVIDRAAGIPELEILKLESSASQDNAIHFYQSQGFEIFGRELRGLKVADDYVDVVHMALRL